MMYKHGGDIYSYNDGVIDFSANINPLGTPKQVIQAANGALKDISHYPDVSCRALRRAIAQHISVPAENIICGNGAAELIFNIVQGIKPHRALLGVPSFSEYELALNTVGAEKVFYNINEETGFRMGYDFADMIDNTIDMVFLCNPNNPTGVAQNRDFVEAVAEKCSQTGTIAVIDECFMDFVDNSQNYSVLPLTGKYPNLVVLRAFTKMYAMAGLRLGYCVCSHKIANTLWGIRQPWSVSSVAQAAGIAALSCKQLPVKTRGIINEEKAYIYGCFDSLGIKYYRSDTNFILFRSGKDLFNQLLQKNILIRDCGNFRGLDNSFYRMAVRLHPDNQLLMQAIEEICG